MKHDGVCLIFWGQAVAFHEKGVVETAVCRIGTPVSPFARKAFRVLFGLKGKKRALDRRGHPELIDRSIR